MSEFLGKVKFFFEKLWEFFVILFTQVLFRNFFSSVKTIVVSLIIFLIIRRIIIKARDRRDEWEDREVEIKNPQDNYCIFKKTYKGMTVYMMCYCNLIYPILKENDPRSNFKIKLKDWDKYGFTEPCSIYQFTYYFEFKKFFGSRKKIEAGYVCKMSDTDISTFDRFLEFNKVYLSNFHYKIYKKTNLKKADLEKALTIEEYKEFLINKKKNKRVIENLTNEYKEYLEDNKEFIRW